MARDTQRRPRGVVAVAASAGGVETLREFVRNLPSDFPLPVLVVLHVPASGPSVLPGILERAGRLPSRHPADGEMLEPGIVYVAPPDRHLSVQGCRVRVSSGPRENGHRPSADVLLRSVAEEFGERCAGVILSGTMDDGALGLRAVRSRGGLAVVQDPEQAAFPGMPRAAMEEAEPQVVCSVPEMGPRLVKWAESLAERGSGEEGLMSSVDPEDGPHEVTEFTCPECGGTLWTVDDHGATRYRCRVGHAFSEGSLILGKQDAVEAALWAAIVALEEKADLSGRIAKRLESFGRTRQIERYRSEITSTIEQVQTLRQVVHGLVSAEHEYEEGSAGAGSL